MEPYKLHDPSYNSEDEVSGSDAVLGTRRLLATVLDQRFSMPQPVIAALFGVKRMTINNAVRETRQLLTQVRHTIQPAGPRLTTLTTHADLVGHVAKAGLDLTGEIKPAC